jgi:methanogenic corrinoid protein MtbC1
MDPVRSLEEALITLNRQNAEKIVRSGMETMGALRCAEELIAPALESIGDGWQEGRIALSQVYMSGKICNDLLDRILPQGSQAREGVPRIAVVALEDYHLLGCKIIVSVLRASGFVVLDYGRLGLPEIITRAKHDDIHLLMVSALMMRSAKRVSDLMAGLRGASLKIRVAVGGSPFNFDPDLWKRVGADTMGRGAGEALRIASGGIA